MSEKKVVSKNIAITLGIICIILVVGLIGEIINYTSIISRKDFQIQTLTSQKNQLQSWLDNNRTLLILTQTWLNGNITYYNSRIDSMESQILILTNQRDQLYSQITSLQNQISTLNSQIQTLNSQIADLQSKINTLTDMLITKRFFYDDFVSSSLSSGWNVENRGGSYSLSNDVLIISSSGQPTDSMTVYRSYAPQSDAFTVLVKVKADTFPAFALRLHAGSLPIFGSTQGAQLEFGARGEFGSGSFDAVWEPSDGGWTWTTIYGHALANIWVILEMQVQRNPFTITFNVYNDTGTLLGTLTTTNLGFSYSDIRYVCLEVWSSPSPPVHPVYQIDWIKII